MTAGGWNPADALLEIHKMLYPERYYTEEEMSDNGLSEEWSPDTPEMIAALVESAVSADDRAQIDADHRPGLTLEEQTDLLAVLLNFGMVTLDEACGQAGLDPDELYPEEGFALTEEDNSCIDVGFDSDHVHYALYRSDASSPWRVQITRNPKETS